MVARSTKPAARRHALWLLYQVSYLLTVAHSLLPIDRMRSGSLTGNIQALRQASTISSQLFQTSAQSLLPRRYAQTFSIGFSSGEYGGRWSKTMLSGSSSVPPR